MNQAVTWGDLLIVYVVISLGTLVVSVLTGLVMAWWENRK